MKNDLENIIIKAVGNIIENSIGVKKINKLKEKHNKKMHFIPKRYRVFGGLLQSMNIQFGNFIEELMALIISNENKFKILEEYSGKKNNIFYLSDSNIKRIDDYIAKCQYEATIDLKKEFHLLQDEIINDKDDNFNEVKCDTDLIFFDSKNIYYLEVKYNDDHDTGKFEDINRKFIRTYAAIATELKNKNYKKNVIPILFYFTNKKMKGNNYIPEETNIRRGRRFFEEFLTIKYDDLEKCLSNISENKKNIKIFDELYQKIMYM